MTIEFDRFVPHLPAVSGRYVSDDASTHFVELYADDESLIASVKKFFSLGIEKGESTILIATRSHREALEIELADAVDLEGARDKGLYKALDAEHCLALIMRDGLPDPIKFEDVVGRMLLTRSDQDPPPRVFGEMVSVLWQQGHLVPALALEDLWNALARRYAFRLFCAYPMTSFDRQDLEALGAVCRRHSHVLVPKAERLDI